MLKAWTPRGPQDPRSWDVYVLALRQEAHRDALVVNFMLTRNNSMLMDLYSGLPPGEELMRHLMTIKLPGAYGLILCEPRGPKAISVGRIRTMFERNFIDKAKEYHAEFGWDFAWFRDIKHMESLLIDRASGRSLTERGRAMRTNLRLCMAQLSGRTFKEKGVTYNTQGTNHG